MLTQIGGYKNEVGGVVHAPDTELDFFLSFIGSGELSGHLCACAPAIILMISLITRARIIMLPAASSR